MLKETNNSEEIINSSVMKTEDNDSNCDLEAIINKTSETVTEKIERKEFPKPMPSTDTKVNGQSLIFNAFDTTGAAVVCKIVAEDKGEALGNTELFNEMEDYFKSKPSLS